MKGKDIVQEEVSNGNELVFSRANLLCFEVDNEDYYRYYKQVKQDVWVEITGEFDPRELYSVCLRE